MGMFDAVSVWSQSPSRKSIPTQPIDGSGDVVRRDGAARRARILPLNHRGRTSTVRSCGPCSSGRLPRSNRFLFSEKVIQTGKRAIGKHAADPREASTIAWRPDVFEQLLILRMIAHRIEI